MLPVVSHPDEERIAYLERLVTQARTASAVFTQYTQKDVDRIVKARPTQVGTIGLIEIIDALQAAKIIQPHADVHGVK